MICLLDGTIPGGYSQKNWVGVWGPLPKTLTLFITMAAHTYVAHIREYRPRALPSLWTNGTWSCNAPINLKLQHPTTHSPPWQTLCIWTFWRLDCSNSCPLVPDWCSNALHHWTAFLCQMSLFKNNHCRFLSSLIKPVSKPTNKCFVTLYDASRFWIIFKTWNFEVRNLKF